MIRTLLLMALILLSAGRSAGQDKPDSKKSPTPREKSDYESKPFAWEDFPPKELKAEKRIDALRSSPEKPKAPRNDAEGFPLRVGAVARPGRAKERCGRFLWMRRCRH